MSPPDSLLATSSSLEELLSSVSTKVPIRRPGPGPPLISACVLMPVSPRRRLGLPEWLLDPVSPLCPGLEVKLRLFSRIVEPFGLGVPHREGVGSGEDGGDLDLGRYERLTLLPPDDRLAPVPGPRCLKADLELFE